MEKLISEITVENYPDHIESEPDYQLRFQEECKKFTGAIERSEKGIINTEFFFIGARPVNAGRHLSETKNSDNITLPELSKLDPDQLDRLAEFIYPIIVDHKSERFCFHFPEKSKNFGSYLNFVNSLQTIRNSKDKSDIEIEYVPPFAIDREKLPAKPGKNLAVICIDPRFINDSIRFLDGVYGAGNYDIICFPGSGICLSDEKFQDIFASTALIPYRKNLLVIWHKNCGGMQHNEKTAHPEKLLTAQQLNNQKLLEHIQKTNPDILYQAAYLDFPADMNAKPVGNSFQIKSF